MQSKFVKVNEHVQNTLNVLAEAHLQETCVTDWRALQHLRRQAELVWHCVQKPGRNLTVTHQCETLTGFGFPAASGAAFPSCSAALTGMMGVILMLCLVMMAGAVLLVAWPSWEWNEMAVHLQEVLRLPFPVTFDL